MKTNRPVPRSAPVFRRCSITGLIAVALLTHALPSKADGPGHFGGHASHFDPIATYQVSGAVAEIVTVTPDGKWLFYTDSETQVVGIVDIRNPAAPVEAGILPVAGEPTSVTITPNGRWVLAVVHGEPDTWPFTTRAICLRRP